jgi:hypothetical protein
MTIDLLEAINFNQLNDTLRNNLINLIDIRDPAIHFFNKEFLKKKFNHLAQFQLKKNQKTAKTEEY